MITRRAFLQLCAFSFVAYHPRIGKVITPPKVQLPNMFEIFHIYASLVGLQSTLQLTSSRAAQNERERVNEIMADGEFTLKPNGRPYQDYRNVSDLPKFQKPRYAETYVVGNENLWDVCVPFYSNYRANERKPLFEGAQLLGTAAAAVQLDEAGYSQAELANMLIPTGHILNPGQEALFSEGWRTNGEYETNNGTLSAFYTPRRDESPATIEVEARGTIDFTQEYEFDVLDVPAFA